MSTIYYKKSLLCCYLMYQYLQTIGRFSGMIIYVSFIDNDHYANTMVINTNNDIANVVILIGLLVCQVFITYFIQEYYTLLPSAKDKARISTQMNV